MKHECTCGEVYKHANEVIACTNRHAIREVASVRFSRDEMIALIDVANSGLCDGGFDQETDEQAVRALRRAVECFGGKWSMNAGAVGHTLHRKR